MESKYYTPDIEEFHDGFKYEAQYNGIWQEQVFGELGIYSLGDPELSLPLRVKYLDAKDIEECGFISGEPYSMSCFMYEKFGGRQLDFHSHKHIVIYDIESSYPVFQGECKNKSELKKILKQIGV